MASPIGGGTGEGERGILDIVLGEALFASTLATAVLTRQVATGWLAQPDAQSLLDGASLVLESHRGGGGDTAAIDHALNRLRGLADLLRQFGAGLPVPVPAARNQPNSAHTKARKARPLV